MTAFLLAELADWFLRRMRRRLVLVALALGGLTAAGLLQPLVAGMAVALVFLGLGWSEGNRYQSGLSSRRLLLGFPATAPALAWGKALSAIVVWAFTLLFLSPPLLLSALAWGLRGDAALALLLSWLVAYLAALSAGFLSSLVFVKSEGLPGAALLLLWLLSPLLRQALAAGNPFFQVWSTVKGGELAPLFLGMGATLLAAALLLSASALAIARIRKSSHG